MNVNRSFKDYKDLDVWRKAFKFGLNVIKLSKALPKNPVNQTLVYQILRSSTSIAGNIAEGSGGSTKRDFINYLNNSRKSALETQNWLEFIFKTNKVTKKTEKLLSDQCIEIIKILTTIIKKAKNSY